MKTLKRIVGFTSLVILSLGVIGWIVLVVHDQIASHGILSVLGGFLIACAITFLVYTSVVWTR